MASRRSPGLCQQRLEPPRRGVRTRGRIGSGSARLSTVDFRLSALGSWLATLGFWLATLGFRLWLSALAFGFGFRPWRLPFGIWLSALAFAFGLGVCRLALGFRPWRLLSALAFTVCRLLWLLAWAFGFRAGPSAGSASSSPDPENLCAPIPIGVIEAQRFLDQMSRRIWLSSRMMARVSRQLCRQGLGYAGTGQSLP